MGECAIEPELTPLAERLFSAFYRSLIVFVVMAFDIFGIRSGTDQLSRDGFLKLLAPMHCDDARRDIVVVLFRDQDIASKDALSRLFSESERPSTSWPLTFDDHALMLEYLEDAQPLAVFIDLLMVSDNNGDPGLHRFLSVVERTVRDRRMLLAYATVPASDRQPVDPPILASLIATGVPTVMVGWAGADGTYPLWVDTVSGTPMMQPADVGADAKATAANFLYAIHQNELAGRTLRPPRPEHLVSGPPMRLVWGYQPANDYVQAGSRCPSWAARMAQSLTLFAHGFSLRDANDVAWTQPQQRFYIDTISARDMVDWAENGVLSDRLKNKIVLVGAALDGIPDVVQSPVNGMTPGVLFHAMALENLIAMDEGYYRDAPAIAGSDLYDLDEITEFLFIVCGYFVIALLRDGAAFQRITSLVGRARKLFVYFVTLNAIALLFTVFNLMFFHVAPSNWIAIATVSLFAVAPDEGVVARQFGCLRPFHRWLVVGLLILAVASLMIGARASSLQFIGAALVVGMYTFWRAERYRSK
jgi:hypothetical protein